MATPTYELIDSTTSSASSVTFSSIPSSYRDIILIAQMKGSTQSAFYIRMNGDSGTNYADLWMLGYTGGSTSSDYLSPQAAASFNNGFVQIWTDSYTLLKTHLNDYSATDKHKTMLSQIGDKDCVEAHAHIWRNTSAITSLTITKLGGNFATSTFYLYGISA